MTWLKEWLIRKLLAGADRTIRKAEETNAKAEETIRRAEDQ